MVGTMPQLGPLPGVQMRLGPSSMMQPQFQPSYPPQGGNLWVPQAGGGQQQQIQQMQPMQQSMGPGMGGPEINELSDGAGAAGSYAQIHTPQGGGKRRGKPPNGGRRMKGSPNGGGNKGSPQQRVIRPRQQRQRGGLKPVRGQNGKRW